MDLVFPQEQHFDCNACGRCCWSWLVHVNQQSYDRLKGTEFLRQAELDRGTPPLVETAPGQYAAIHKEDDSCTFLLPDNRCEIHAALGGKQKPTSCQQFPFILVKTPDGVHVGVSFYCDAVQRNEGGDLNRYASDVRDWLAVGQYPTVTEATLRLAPDVPMTWPEYRGFETWLGQKLDAIPEPSAALWMGVLAVCRMALRGHFDLTAIPQTFLWGPAFDDYTRHCMAVVASLWEGDSKTVRAAMLAGTEFFSTQLGRTVQAVAPTGDVSFRVPIFQRYLRQVLFRKWLALLPLTLSTSALYVASNLLDYYCFLSAAGGTPTEKDVWKAIDVVEVNFLGHNFGQVDMYPHLATGFLEQIRASSPSSTPPRSGAEAAGPTPSC